MNEKGKEDEHGITKITSRPSSGLSKVIFLILSSTIVVVLIMYLVIEYKGGTQSSTNNSSSTIPISTTGWTEVETNGKGFDTYPLVVDNVELAYLVRIGDVKGREFELHSTRPRAWYGDEKKIDKVYYRLKPGQGFKEAEIQFKFK